MVPSGAAGRREPPAAIAPAAHGPDNARSRAVSRRLRSSSMKSFARGAAALCIAAIATVALAQGKKQDPTVLNSDRDKVSYAIGMDVGRSIKPVGPDLDLAAFEQAVGRTFAGQPPALSQ